jgi:uncharacterized membrane protein
MAKHPSNRSSQTATPPPEDSSALHEARSAPRTSVQVMEMSWQGPIPPPQELKRYDEIIENGAERLFSQFERETQHRHLLERRAQNYPLFDQLAARTTALVFSLGCLGVALYAVEKNHPWVAGAFGAAMIANGINAFLRQSTPPPRSSSEQDAKRSKRKP